MISDQPRRQKSREVSSRYLSPTVPPPLAPPSPNNNHALSPNRQNPKPSPSTKHKHTRFIRGLWPSSAPHSLNSHNHDPPTAAAAATTLADHLGNQRRKDGVKIFGNSPFLSKQRSCSEFRRSEKNAMTQSSLKENHTPISGGGSMRYTGKLIFPGRSSISSSTSSSSSSKSSDFFDSNQVILPGRLSVDENALHRRSSFSQMRSDSSFNDLEYGDLGSPFMTRRNFPASYAGPTLSSRKSETEVPSKYMNPSIPIDNSPTKSTLKTAMKKPKWGSFPGRLGSPPATNPSFSSSKPSSPSRGKKNFLHMGLDLIKGKKSGSNSVSGAGSSTMESVHQLRIMQSSWMQWRYANARAEAVHENLAAQCKNNLLYATKSMAKLRQSVVQKRLQLQKEKLEMKLNFILHSQIKMLEAWGEMERRHAVDVSMMKDCLHAVICRVPLIEGAKVDLELASIAFRHASHLVSTIKSMLTSFSPMALQTIIVVLELAEVVAKEKSLLEECFEHFRLISTLETQERSLRCSIIAMDSSNEQQRQQQQQISVG